MLYLPMFSVLFHSIRSLKTNYTCQLLMPFHYPWRLVQTMLIRRGELHSVLLWYSLERYSWFWKYNFAFLIIPRSILWNCFINEFYFFQFFFFLRKIFCRLFAIPRPNSRKLVLNAAKPRSENNCCYWWVKKWISLQVENIA